MNLNIKPIFWRWLPWLIIALGIILRLDQYLFNRSLWLDEAFIAVNFIDKTLWELLQPPLDYSHSIIIPPGFLIMAKLSITLFGNSDFILRLFPFICGVTSLLLFYYMAKAYISNAAVPLALFLFAISNSLIFYSSEFKQYSSDVTITIALFLLVTYIQTHRLTIKRLLLLAILGALAVWFSHPAAFILATIGSYFMLWNGLNRKWQQMIIFAIVSFIWLLSFLVMYFFTMGGGLETSPIGDYLLHLWKSWNTFMPSPFSMEGIQWLYDKYIKMFEYPASLGIFALAAGLFFVGCITLLAHRKGALFLLTVPFVVVLATSYFEKYPFADRMILFLVPAMYLIIAEAVIQIQVKLLSYKSVTVAVQIILFAAVVNYPIYSLQLRQETKPVFEYLQKNVQTTDTLYLYQWVEPAFRYYASNYNFNYNDCHIVTHQQKSDLTREIDYFRSKQGFKPVSVNETQCILGISGNFYQVQPELEKLQNRGRVWFVFSHINEHERSLFLNYLDTKGVRIDDNWQPGASVHLYQL